MSSSFWLYIFGLEYCLEYFYTTVCGSFSPQRKSHGVIFLCRQWRLSTVFHFRPRLCGFLCNVHLFHILRDFSYMYFFAYLLKSLNVICIVLHTIVLQSALCFLPHSDCKSCIELKKRLHKKKLFRERTGFFECTIYFSYEKRFVYNKKYISLT